MLERISLINDVTLKSLSAVQGGRGQPVDVSSVQWSSHVWYVRYDSMLNE